MAKIKAGDFEAVDINGTGHPGSVSVTVDSINESGDFVVNLGGASMTAEQARANAAVLMSAADKAEILTAAIGG